jgi:GNAT superfamily N-acetyltransferase
MNISLKSDLEFVELRANSIFVDEVKELVKEYGNYMYKDLGLIAGRENFFKELEGFPGNVYSPPFGTFIIVKTPDVLIGCGGIKKLDMYRCEMKRLFIRQPFRGKGIGMLICNFLVEYARQLKYKSILLDTNVEMKEAVILYKKYGFKEIKPYCVNENEHPIFMEYTL